MKSREVPTSPKNRVESKDIDTLYKMEPTIVRPSSGRAPLMVATLIVSCFLTLGMYVVLRITADHYPDRPILRYFQTSTSTERIEVQPASTQESELQKTISDITPSLGAIVTADDGGIRSQDDVIGNVVMVSNDGVAIGLTSQSSVPRDAVVKSSDGVERGMDSIQIDSATGTIFVDLGASASPVTFADSSQVAIGDSVMVLRFSAFSGSVSYVPSTIRGLRERSTTVAGSAELLESSEVLDRMIRLSDTFDASWDGAGVFTPKGRLIGLISGSDETGGSFVTPINCLKQPINGYLSSQVVERAFLGVHYVDLSYHTAISSTPLKGAYLYSDDKKRPAVTSKSPASAAGLLSEDVVTAVDSVPLNELVSLSDAIAGHLPGDTIVLTILRDEAEKKVTVELGTQTTE